MKVLFKINVHTKFGQNVFLVGNHKKLGNNIVEKAIQLEYVNENGWVCELELGKESIEYYYFIKEDDKIYKESQSRKIDLSLMQKKEVVFHDFWTYPSLPEINFSTKFFQNLSQFRAEKPSNYKSKTLLFRLKANLFNPDLKVCILGDCKELNNWNTKKPKLLKQVDFSTWEIPIEFEENRARVTYKYGVYHKKRKVFLRFEQGNNRFCYPKSNHTFLVINDNNFVNLPNENWRGTGVAIPVFALRSKNSFGVGEFLDLKPLADWCETTGIKMIQILPINDTTATNTWTDSYPYAGISIYALHPQFLNIDAIPYEKPEDFEKKYKKLKKELNSLEQIDYEKVNKAKLEFLYQIFELNVGKIRRSRKFKKFSTENEKWLKPYAAFSVLRDENKTADFTKWKKDKTFSNAILNKVFRKNSKKEKQACFYQFIQWQLHEQLLEVSNYIHKKKIVLKGDIPIGIYRHSADSWTEPNLYHQDQQAGAPPDDFAVLGQNWEFPTYNWQEMQKDGYTWWKNRFQHMSQYFDAFRIDHILGFFRIWQIPKHCTQGILGYFSPALHISVVELFEKGIGWDEKRMTKPFLDSGVLHQFFGNQLHELFDEFFQESFGIVEFKPKYDTQRKVEENFKGEEHIKDKLLALHANVIFINSGTSEKAKLHPRFALQNTLSFQYFPDDVKQKLIELHNDYYYHRNEWFWKENAMQKLPELKQSTDMLICGEDLGLVPKVVPQVMNELAILSLQIQRMPSGNERFSFPQFAPYLSVVSPSSHDTSTLRQWWEESRDNAQFYYNHVITKNGGAPGEMTSEIMHSIIDQHLWSPAMLAVIPIQEFFALDDEITNPNKEVERINEPAVFPHYWRYRMHISLEDLLKKEEFNEMLKDKMLRSGRIID